MQEKLSEKSDLSLRTTQKIKTRETEPKENSHKKLALAFNLPTKEMIARTATKLHRKLI